MVPNARAVSIACLVLVHFALVQAATLRNVQADALIKRAAHGVVAETADSRNGMADNSQSDTRIDHDELANVRQEAHASHAQLSRNMPSRESVAVLLRGASFRGGHLIDTHDCFDGSVDAQLEATNSVIEHVLNPLVSMFGNSVDLFVSRHGDCEHDSKLLRLYQQWAEHTNQQVYPFTASSASQDANMRDALDFVRDTPHRKYKLLIVLRHDVQLKRPIPEWPADFKKVNFASKCFEQLFTFLQCTSDTIMTVPSEYVLAFDKIVGSSGQGCFSSECPQGHCCNFALFPAIGEANVGELFPVGDHGILNSTWHHVYAADNIASHSMAASRLHRTAARLQSRSHTSCPAGCALK